jgi:hypothetical protein
MDDYRSNSAAAGGAAEWGMFLRAIDVMRHGVMVRDRSRWTIARNQEDEMVSCCKFWWSIYEEAKEWSYDG